MLNQASISNADGEFIWSLPSNSVLTSYQRATGERLGEVQMIQGKPRTEKVGGKLDQYQLTGLIEGPNSDDLLAPIFNLKRKANPVVLVIAGKPKGRWSIQHIREDVSETLPNGQSKRTKFVSQLKEFANEA